MSQPISLDQLNQFSHDQFVEALGGIFEHSPWVADFAYEYTPFETAEQLQQTMLKIVQQSPEFQRMALICSHPELAGKEAAAGTLTSDSKQEQARAGLDQCSAAELAQLQTLNQAYHDKFEFPFIIAVSGLNRSDIIEALDRRLHNNPEQEFDTSIAEVGKIATIRLNALIQQ